MAASRSLKCEDTGPSDASSEALLLAHPLGLMKDDVVEGAVDHSRAAAPLPSAMRSATRQALAMIVSVGLAPVPVGKGEPSTA
jgi:hypothetical protein